MRIDDITWTLDISIHAPVKGATGSPSDYDPMRQSDISIHAPVKGATRRLNRTRRLKRHFNPRTREGCDSQSAIADVQANVISIHAPVKGATPRPCAPDWKCLLISIHAPVKGATIAIY